MKFILTTFLINLFLEPVPAGLITKINESWVCSVKLSCLECLRFPQCTWCEETNECFSSELLLPGQADFCKGKVVLYVDKGMSFEDNAKCACLTDSLQQDCTPPDQTDDGPVCSDRGKCECGRCFCDPTPDSNHTSKVIMGKYCEFDNFSCDEPRCNEGPYHIYNSSYNLKTTS